MRFARSLAKGERHITRRLHYGDRALAWSRRNPPCRFVAQRRATFAATPEPDALRRSSETHWPNLFLAGAWAQTGLPDAMESAAGSAAAAAERAAPRAGGVRLCAAAWVLARALVRPPQGGERCGGAGRLAACRSARRRRVAD
jgi:hypothetical protein